MKKIKAYVDYEDETKTHYYKNFEVIENLPELETETIKNENYLKVNMKMMNVNLKDMLPF